MSKNLLLIAFAALFAVTGCNNDQGLPRSGGSGGAAGFGGIGASGGLGGTGGASCNCPLGEDCQSDGSCLSVCAPAAPCVNGSTFQCCPGGFVCDEGACVQDCSSGVICDGLCCDAGQMCADNACVAQCADVAQLCGAQNELCCDAGDACIGDACVTPGADCTFAEECELDELCDASLGKCIPRDSVPACEFRPPVGVLAPNVACRWTPPEAAPGATAEEIEIAGMAEVVMTPSVLNMTDDNLDGLTDTRDMPDIVFVSFDRTVRGCCTSRGVVRVVSGGCNPDGTMTTIATLRGMGPRTAPSEPNGFIGNSTGIALGNLHPDTDMAERNPEIVATFWAGGTIAWRRTAPDGSTWEILWQNDTAPTRSHTHQGGAQPQIADLNADGQPEVIVGNVVLNGLTGALLWDGLTTATNPNPGIGNNAFLGPVSTVADFDLNGEQEVMAGNTMYAADGTELWTHDYTTSNSTCQGALDCDGYNGVGNFDADDEGEVVIIREGQLFVLNHDGTPVTGIPSPIDVPMIDLPSVYFPAGYVPDQPLFDATGQPLPTTRPGCGGAAWFAVFDAAGDPVTVDDGNGMMVQVIAIAGNNGLASNESGPPTVADFDGDGFAEVGTASSTSYVVFDFQCTGTPLPEGCQAEWIRWTVGNNDCSSRATGSSVFDFEGDGPAEVVYADETTFRIFSGVDGTILYEDDTHRSNTRVEMPLVVDVDNDGKSEVIIPEPHTSDTLGGIEVWEDADNNWVRTRRVWNEHQYSVTNITEDGQIPRVPEVNWLNSRLNNYRQNTQPGGLFDAPDFVVKSILRKSCDMTQITVDIAVGNDGALSVPPGILTHVVAQCQSGTVVDLGSHATQTWLLPGQTESLEVVFTLPPTCPATSDVIFTANMDDDGMGNGQYNECDDANNGFMSNGINCSGVN